MGRAYTLRRSTAFIVYTFRMSEISQTSLGPRRKYHWNAKHYNCHGKFYRGHGVHSWDEKYVIVGRPVDVRTLQLIKMGCCPDRLMKDFIMTEGGELAGRDSVLEAMALHKRGYLGGGG